MSEAMQSTKESDVNKVAANALRNAARCVDELVERGEPMGPRQTFRRGFNAADEFLVDSALSGSDFDEAVDIVGDATGMALDRDIDGTNAAEFYRNKADSIEN